MKHLNVVLTLCFVSIVTNAFNQTADIKTAEKVAVNFYYQQFNSFEGSLQFDEIQIEDSHILKYEMEDALYIFNVLGGGFVIVPSEKAIEPILGYSFEGHYDPDNTDNNSISWLNTYVKKVGSLKQNEINATTELNKKWEDILSPNANTTFKTNKTKDIDPLLISTWGDDFPYNIYCPEDPDGPGGYCNVGPVGTAMGQIMNYWRYPLMGIGSISYYVYPYGTISVNFEETSYEWDAMTEIIDINNPHPIATLLFHCAASVQTNFGPDGSGAYSTDADNALIDYFGYDASCQYLQKSSFTLSTWKQMLKDELDIFHPIYYSGTSTTNGGHAFVIDGYQESDDDYFHLNIGWSGYMNGWYLITDAGGYTQNQNMIRNIFPGSGYPYYCQGTTTISYLNGSIDDGSGPTNNYQDNANCDWLIAPQSNNDSISGIVINFSSFHTEQDNDVVAIYDGPTNDYPLLGIFSGSTLPTQIISTSAEVLINFSSNESISESGWHLSYESIYPEFCSQLQTYVSSTGTISDGSESFNYQNDTHCSWLLTPLDASQVTFYFTSFDTEEDVDDVEIFDASNNQLLASYSGSYSSGNLPPSVTSFSGEMLITFETDLMNTAQGWEGIYVSETWMPQPASIIIEDSIYKLDITWEMPDTLNSGFNFVGFNLFKNGTQLNTSLIPNTTYSETVSPGEYEYCVTAVYEEGESNPNCASIVVPCYGTLESNVSNYYGGSGIEGITVIVGDTNFISGPDGFKSFMLPEGSYSVIINEPGFEPLSSSVDIMCDVVTGVDLVLTPTLPPPTDFDAVLLDLTTAYCSWTPANTSGVIYDLLGYNIYRNDTLLNTNLIVGNFYYDFDYYEANQEYCVAAVYEVAESTLACMELLLETGNLDGFVLNINTFNPIEGAVVSLGIYNGTSDASGYFEIPGIIAGSYEVGASAENYYPFPPGAIIDILAGNNETLDITLAPMFLNPPLSLQFEIVGEEELLLFWDPPQTSPWELEGYNVYRRDYGVGEFVKINNTLVSSSSYYDTEFPLYTETEYYITSLYDTGESDSSNTVLVVITNILEQSIENISIYPNPAKDKLFITLPKNNTSKLWTIRFYNVQGEYQSILSAKPNGDNQIIIDLLNFNKGVYIVNINSVGINIAKKVIIK